MFAAACTQWPLTTARSGLGETKYFSYVQWSAAAKYKRLSTANRILKSNTRTPHPAPRGRGARPAWRHVHVARQRKQKKQVNCFRSAAANVYQAVRLSRLLLPCIARRACAITCEVQRCLHMLPPPVLPLHFPHSDAPEAQCSPTPASWNQPDLTPVPTSEPHLPCHPNAARGHLSGCLPSPSGQQLQPQRRSYRPTRDPLFHRDTGSVTAAPSHSQLRPLSGS